MAEREKIKELWDKRAEELEKIIEEARTRKEVRQKILEDFQIREKSQYTCSCTFLQINTLFIFIQ